MPSLLLPRQWTSQPQIPVGVDWSNPLSRGLVFASYGGNDRNLVTSRQSSSTVAPSSVTPASTGLKRDFNGSTSAVLFQNETVLTGDLFTFACNIYPTSVSSRFTVFGCENFANGFMLEIGAVFTSGTSTMSALYSGVGSPDQAVDNSITVNAWNRICYVRTNGNPTSKFYVNGFGVDLRHGLTSPFSSSAHSRTLGRRSSGSQPFLGAIEYAFLYSRALSEAEIKSLAANPYQIFRPLVT